MKSTMVAGHGLQGEGAAYIEAEYPGSGWQRVIYNSVSGEGFGVCACGDYSHYTYSAAERRRWHNTHKANVLETRNNNPHLSTLGDN